MHHYSTCAAHADTWTTHTHIYTHTPPEHSLFAEVKREGIHSSQDMPSTLQQECHYQHMQLAKQPRISYLAAQLCSNPVLAPGCHQVYLLHSTTHQLLSNADCCPAACLSEVQPALQLTAAAFACGGRNLGRMKQLLHHQVQGALLVPVAAQQREPTR